MDGMFVLEDVDQSHRFGSASLALCDSRQVIENTYTPSLEAVRIWPLRYFNDQHCLRLQESVWLMLSPP